MAKNDLLILAAIVGGALLLSGKNPIDILGGGGGGSPAQGGNGSLFDGGNGSVYEGGNDPTTYAAPPTSGGNQAQGGDYYNGFTPATLPEGVRDPNNAVGTGGGLVLDRNGNYRFRSGGFVGVSPVSGEVIPASFGSATLTPAQQNFLIAAEQGRTIGQGSSRSRSKPEKNRPRFVGGIASGPNQNFTPNQLFTSNQNFSSIFG